MVQPDKSFDWDDLRQFLEVVRSGSTLAAARRLGLNQSTVARRIAAFEAALGVTLFDRRPSGYAPTDKARELVVLAEAAETAALGVAQCAARWRREITGRLRVTSTETVVNVVLAPLVASLRAAHPGLMIELVTEDRRLELGRGDADVAIRVGPKPEGDGLVVRRIGASAWSAYASEDYVKKNGLPEAAQGMKGHAIILGDGPLTDNGPLQWLAQHASGAVVATRVTSISALLASVRAGVGIGALPDLVAVREAGLVRLFDGRELVRAPFWLAYHGSLRARPELRCFVDVAVARFAALRPGPGPKR